MNLSSITILFPHPVSGPTGGYKVLYEYANRMVKSGYRVSIVYAGSIFWKQKPLRYKLTNVVRYIEHRMKGYKAKKWFTLDSRIKENLSFSLNYRHVTKSDIYIATSPYTAYYLKDYPISKNRKYYFIQGYENWGEGLRKILVSTYHAPLNKIVVSRWLQKMLQEEFGESSFLVRNGFNRKEYYLTIPIDKKERMHVSMLYSENPSKGVMYGVQALISVKAQLPELKATLFGALPRPECLPDWMEYIQCPDYARHLMLNNVSAIYVAPGLSEGWGLTVGEAMLCGQAIVCTDIDGYMEMAENGKNALISPAGDSDQMATHIIQLIRDDEIRKNLACQGLADIASFDIEQSYNRLIDYLNSYERIS
jgi:glycosyltransferase involved in cell wall biosynthesis